MSKVVFPLLFLIVAVGLFFSYVNPAIRHVSEYTELSEQLTGVIAKYERLYTERDSLLERYQAVPHLDELALQQILPSGVDPIRFVIDVDNVTSPIGFDIRSFDLPWQDARSRALTQGKVGDFNVSTMSIEFEGRYADFKRFLYYIETSRTLTDIVDISVETQKAGKTETENGTETIDTSKQIYNITMHIYWLTEE